MELLFRWGGLFLRVKCNIYEHRKEVNVPQSGTWLIACGNYNMCKKHAQKRGSYGIYKRTDKKRNT